eukprot:CAMPEP_0197067928 /NCGR_PEP_ID=MMETSP1384-20130603/183337_1 /TAXON_ID=29189 /ORGANISM="Ammonia sp." /LENGTH=83 /DNA_ID=CAMNT_0042505511 /DNA_START=26 /DNA_END=274 /DNA_ORIENTATION=-
MIPKSFFLGGHLVGTCLIMSSDLEEQLQEFESIQSIYDSDKLSFDANLISKLQSAVDTDDNAQLNGSKLTFRLSITDALFIDC